jgi:hypothetical protein
MKARGVTLCHAMIAKRKPLFCGKAFYVSIYSRVGGNNKFRQEPQKTALPPTSFTVQNKIIACHP